MDASAVILQVFFAFRPASLATTDNCTFLHQSQLLSRSLSENCKGYPARDNPAHTRKIPGTVWKRPGSASFRVFRVFRGLKKFYFQIPHSELRISHSEFFCASHACPT